MDRSQSLGRQRWESPYSVGGSPVDQGINPPEIALEMADVRWFGPGRVIMDIMYSSPGSERGGNV